MKKLVILLTLLLAGCVGNKNYAEFKITSVGDSCDALFDGDKPYTRPYEGKNYVLAVGNNCPESLPGYPDIGFAKRKIIQVGPKGRYVKVQTAPDPKTGYISQQIIRRNENFRGASRYRIFSTGIKR